MPLPMKATLFGCRTAFAMQFSRKWVWILLTAVLSILCWVVLFPTVLWLCPVINGYYPWMLKFMHRSIPFMAAILVAITMTKQYHTATILLKALDGINLQKYPLLKRYAYLSKLLAKNYQAITAYRAADTGMITVSTALAKILAMQFPGIVKDVDSKSRQRRSRC